MRKIFTIGAISTAIGSIGAALSGISFCPCVLIPVLSIAGGISIGISFLTKTNIIFLTIGIILLISSLIFHKKRKTCKIHKKE